MTKIPYPLNRGVEIHICHECGFVEPYSHDEGVMACNCSKPTTKKEFQEALKKAEERVNE